MAGPGGWYISTLANVSSGTVGKRWEIGRVRGCAGVCGGSGGVGWMSHERYDRVVFRLLAGNCRRSCDGIYHYLITVPVCT